MTIISKKIIQGKTMCFLYITILISSILGIVQSAGFGGFVTDVETFNACYLDTNNDKPNASESNFVVKYDKNPSGLVSGNLKIFEDVGPLQYKLKVWQWNGKKFQVKIDEPYKNACTISNIRKKLFEKFVKFVTIDETCIVKQGSYNLEDLDVDEMAQTISANNFFYGRFKTTLQFITGKYHVLCVETIVSLKKKD